MRYIGALALFIFVTLMQINVVFGGAWTQKKGHYFSKLSILRFKSSSQYLLNGERQTLADNGRVVDLNLNFYLEYGLFEQLTFITSISFKKINFSCAIEDCDNTSSGLGDIFIGLRYRLSQTNWVFSLQSDLKIAPGYETDPEALNSAPPLGDGQTDFDMRLLLGRSIWHYRGYINMDLGLRARSGEPVNEIPYSVELGIDLTRDYLLIGQISGVRSISENQNQTDFRIVNGMVQNFVGTGAVEDYLKAHLQLIYRLNSKMELSFMFEQLLSGRNTSHATILGGGLILHN